MKLAIAERMHPAIPSCMAFHALFTMASTSLERLEMSMLVVTYFLAKWYLHCSHRLLNQTAALVLSLMMAACTAH